MSGGRRFRAVIFDLGGVVFESPLQAIARYEEETGLPAGVVNQVVAASGPQGAWARHERGEIPTSRFLVELREELRRHGAEVDTVELMRRVDDSIRPRPRMVEAVGRLREAGLRVAACTNNWAPFADHPVLAEFDVVVESVLEGVRKPEPAIYRLTLQRLGVAAEETVMLDDIGANLKPARELGMTTIKVGDPEEALRELYGCLGWL